MMSRRALILTLAVAAVLGLVPAARAATTCTFTIVGDTLVLDADCTTDSTISIPDGMTLDGANHTITAVDPAGPGGAFAGAVVKNDGTTAHVTRLTVTADGLKNACQPSGPIDKRLRGILFVGASGSIVHSEVIGINKGASGCQEGNAIEARNFADAPGPVEVEVAHNVVGAYQKTGIVANGDVIAGIHHNVIGESATQANLAANAVQIGFGARGTVLHNAIAGNQWCGGGGWVATAVLLYQADAGTEVSKNNIGGDSDVGIYVYSDGVRIDNNRVFDEGADCDTDYGVGDWGSNNVVTNNKVRGYEIPYDPSTLTGKSQGHNKTIPQPHE